MNKVLVEINQCDTAIKTSEQKFKISQEGKYLACTVFLILLNVTLNCF